MSSRPVLKRARRNPDPCAFCSGTGRIDRFSHYANGVCFQCGGTGKERQDRPESRTARLAPPAPPAPSRPLSINGRAGRVERTTAFGWAPEEPDTFSWAPGEASIHSGLRFRVRNGVVIIREATPSVLEALGAVTDGEGNIPRAEWDRVLVLARQALQAALKARRNPITLEVQPGTGRAAREALEKVKQAGPIARKHLDFFFSPKALAVIEQKGAEVVPNIRVVISTKIADPSGLYPISHSVRNTITLFIDVLSEAMFAVRCAATERRDLQVAPHTAHVLLHRLGDYIFMDQVKMDVSHGIKPFAAGADYYPEPLRIIAALLREAGVHDPGAWLPAVVDTKACRAGWVKLGSQALAELVPHLLLYPKGRTEGIRFRPVPESMVPGTAQRNDINRALKEAEPTMTAYIRRKVRALQDRAAVILL